MSGAHKHEDQQHLLIGPNRVAFEHGALAIYARHPFRDWQIREFNRLPISFHGQKFYLRRKDPAPPPFAMRYELALWPADLHDQSTRHFAYDMESISERDSEVVVERQANAGRSVLLLFYPFLGFFWSRIKRDRFSLLGFPNVRITKISILSM